MQLVRGLINLKKIKSSVVSIGNFDGLHLAHQQIIKNLVIKAQELASTSVIITFYPHPSIFFNRHKNIITSLHDKYNMLKRYNIDIFLAIHFNQDFVKLSADDFINNILINKLNTKHIIVGDDFKFGYDKLGDIHLLKKSLPTTSINTQILEGQRVSSSNIRNLLITGNIKLANKLLGYNFQIVAKVIAGNKIGRTLGFPTANLATKNLNIPLRGVFAADAIIDNKIYQGALNVGTKPSINNQAKLSAEIHLLEFNKNIYNKMITIIPKAKLRDELAFANVNDLISQIKKDILLIKNQV